MEVAPRPPPAVTNAVSWRSEKIKYRKNEVFLDVIESVNLLVSGNKHINMYFLFRLILSEWYNNDFVWLNRSVLMVMCFEVKLLELWKWGCTYQGCQSWDWVSMTKCCLRAHGVSTLHFILWIESFNSYLFVLKLVSNWANLYADLLGGKSKSVELEDVKFHQCVRLSRFENDRTISFIPPDGEFELMSYRLNTHVSWTSVKFRMLKKTSIKKLTSIICKLYFHLLLCLMF